MSPRPVVWVLGGVVTVGVWSAIDRDPTTRPLAVPLALLVLAMTAMAGELSAIRSLRTRQGRFIPPPGAKPADGVVEILPIAGIGSVANPVDPRFLRFNAIDRTSDLTRPVRRVSPTRPSLLGRVTLISVFVGRDGKAWTSEEIARGLEAIERAALWIEREAARQEVPVNLAMAETYFEVQDDSEDEVEVAFAIEGDDIGPMEAKATTKAVAAASRAAARLGFLDIVDLVGTIEARVEGDAKVWLVHLRRAGRSLAIPADESEGIGVGLAVGYSKEVSFPEPLQGPGRVDPTTVAHELLHLFGATDKYGQPLRSFAVGTVSSGDIMRLNHDRLSRMTIDPLTAREIGWTVAALPARSTKKARR